MPSDHFCEFSRASRQRQRSGLRNCTELKINMISLWSVSSPLWTRFEWTNAYCSEEQDTIRKENEVVLWGARAAVQGK
jgi:hypothetical protein